MPDVTAALNPMTDQTTRTRRFVHALRSKAWLWVLPTLLGFAAASIWSARTPEIYRATAQIRVDAGRTPYVAENRPGVRVDQRIPALKAEILSRTRLARIIQDLDLYAAVRQSQIMEEVVDGMRSNINVIAVGEDAVAISFTGDNPRQAMRVADRLAALFIEESTRDRRVFIQNSHDFLENQLQEQKRRLEAVHNRAVPIERGVSGNAPSMAELIELESAKEAYKAMLARRQEWETVAALDRRELGERFQMVEAPRVPERPIGPARLLVTCIATLSGLAIGLILVALSSSRIEEVPAEQSEPA
jgi:uncharacterized protein involved in exopolysaccharide biosynthesis